MGSQKRREFECCPPFHPEVWDDKMLLWNDKLFVKDHVLTAFHFPLNIGGVIRRMDNKVSNAGANIADGMCLSDHTSKWNMDLYLAVDKEIPHAKNKRLTGKFYSKVYGGSIVEMKIWNNDYEQLVKSKGLSIKKRYMWCITCPKCAEEYGKSYVVIFGEVTN